MPATVSERILEQISAAERQYSRLVLVVGPPGSGKTEALRSLAAEKGYRYLNAGVELAQALVELGQRERALRARRILEELVGASSSVVLLDNIEVLFEASLRLEPLGCLEAMARNRTVVAAWSGELSEDQLTYAAPGHPEYKRYPARGLLIVLADSGTKVP